MTVHEDVTAFNRPQTDSQQEICQLLPGLISILLPDAENKIWHRHPVWFLAGNPIVGYGKLKAGIRLMFWSGASFEEERLKPGSGKFKDASILYTSVDQIDRQDLGRWISKSKTIQWDYKNAYKRKGKLVRLEL
ncbi:MAG: DUF1801 domain-containing protein [Saprospiraceae bacterium]|nr:DUF1801 domain-containing protein [Saprospiraceae bacterium]